MTREEIADYVSYESVDHSKRKLTVITFNSGAVQIAHLFKSDQQNELMEQNQWLFKHMSGDLLKFNGDEILSLRVQ